MNDVVNTWAEPRVEEFDLWVEPRPEDLDDYSQPTDWEEEA